MIAMLIYSIINSIGVVNIIMEKMYGVSAVYGNDVINCTIQTRAICKYITRLYVDLSWYLFCVLYTILLASNFIARYDLFTCIALLTDLHCNSNNKWDQLGCWFYIYLRLRIKRLINSYCLFTTIYTRNKQNESI